MSHPFSLTVIYAGLLLIFTFNHLPQDFATTIYFLPLYTSYLLAYSRLLHWLCIRVTGARTGARLFYVFFCTCLKQLFECLWK